MIYQYRTVNLLFQSEFAKPVTGQFHMQSHICYVVRRGVMFVSMGVGVQTKCDKPVFGHTNYVTT